MTRKLYVVVLLIGLASAPAALAQGERQWIGSVSPGQSARLAYGTPNTDDTFVLFHCDIATRQLGVVVPGLDPTAHEDGDGVTFRLSSEAGEVTLKATATVSPMDDLLIVEAATTLSPDLQRLLVDGQNLTVTFEGAASSVTLAGAAAAGVAMFKACGTR